MVNFCVVGQSNSIMADGFVAQVRRQSNHNMKASGRIGASPSVLGPFFLTDEFVSGCQFCLIDVCVVDAEAMHNGAIDAFNVCDYLSWAGHFCRQRKCEPIFIIIPPLSLVGNSYLHNYFFSIYESIIRSGGYYYLDVREMLSRLSASGNTSPSHYYSDPSHLGIEISSMIAERICRQFDKTSTGGISASTTFLDRHFKRFNLSLFAPATFERASYQTSLYSFSGVRLRSGSLLRVPVGNIKRVHGIVVNSARSNNKLRFNGNTTVVKSFILKPYSSLTNFECRLVPICSPLSDLSGNIDITIASDNEKTNDPTMQEQSGPSRAVCVEVSDLLVEYSSSLVSYNFRMLDENNII